MGISRSMMMISGRSLTAVSHPLSPFCAAKTLKSHSRRMGSHALAEEQTANARHPGHRSVSACAGR